MTAVFPGGATNTYVPSTEATNNMIVDFSRNVDSFAINKYIQVMPVSNDVGYFTRMTVEEAGRILRTNLADHVWADGEDAPSTHGNTEKHDFIAYKTQRYHYGFNLGKKAAEQASWDILAQHGRIKAQQAMTARTQLAVTLATTSGTYDSTHVSAAASIPGATGAWDVSTTARQDIKRSIDYALDIIRLDTLGAVNVSDFKLVMSPGCARKIAISQEIVDFIKGSPAAMDHIRGKLGPNAQYGLPADLYGVEVVIEDAVKVTSRKGATRAASYVLGDATPFIVARPGSLVVAKDSNQAPRFSALTMFAYEEMTVESKYDEDNRVHRGRIVEDYVMAATAPIAGFLFTAAVS